MAGLPSRVSGSPFERPTLAFANLLRGDLEGMARGLVSPESLAPGQMRTWADEYGVGQGNTIYDTALRAVSNPIVLIGAILAMKYPIPRAGQMLRYAKHLTGLDRKVGPVMRHVGGVDEIYHGVMVPGGRGIRGTLPEAYKGLLSSVEHFRRGHADRIGVFMNEAVAKGFDADSLQNQILIAAKLGGMDRGPKAIFKSIDLGEVGNTLVSQVRTVTNEVYDKVMGTIVKRQTLLMKRRAGMTAAMRKAAFVREDAAVGEFRATAASLASQKGVLTRAVTDQLRASGIDPTDVLNIMAKGRHKVKFYWPHMTILKEEEWAKQSQAMLATMLKSAGGREKLLGQRNVAAAVRVSTAHVEARAGRMIPEVRDLKVVEDWLKPGQLQKMTGRLATAVKEGQDLRQYSLRFMPVISSYLHSTARAYGWTIKGYGSKIAGAVGSLESSGTPGNLARAAWMRDSYIPLALGRQTYRQMLASMRWNQWKLDLSNKLVGDRARNIAPSPWAKHVPAEVKGWLSSALSKDRGIFSMKNVSGRAAGYLYLSTLGIPNAVSSSYNLMQMVLTTVPTIGAKWTMHGLREVFRKAPRYFDARMAKKTHDQALALAWPEFKEAGLVAAPLAEEAIGEALNKAWEISLSVPTPVAKGVSRAKAAMMSLFQASETIVRLASFEGGKAKALADGLSKSDALFFGRRVTEMTQYLAGPANVPALMKEWNPLARQFGHFPGRTVEFLLGPGTELGSGAKTGFLGRNWGTLGRTLLTSGLAYEAGQELFDRDLSHGLLWGALPIPHERQAFAPLPFVPPAASIVGGAAMDLMKGELDYSRYSLPLLIPGGLGLAKLSTAAVPDLARVLGRGYADYEGQLPDGRIPVLTSKGALRGYMTPMQLYMDSLGLGGGDPEGRKEKELQRYLLGQRDRIRMFRREFLEALTDNDVKEAHQIQEDYEALYPGMGGLQVKSIDYQAVHRRKMIPRLELMLETLPAEARGPMSQLIAMTLSDEADEFLGVDPFLLQELPTIRQRDPYRDLPPAGVMETIYRGQVNRGLIRREPNPALDRGQGGGPMTPWESQQRASYGRESAVRMEATPRRWAAGGFSSFRP